MKSIKLHSVLVLITTIVIILSMPTFASEISREAIPEAFATAYLNLTEKKNIDYFVSLVIY